MSENPSMTGHPDLAEVQRAHDMQELRLRYDRASESATGQLVEGLIVLAGLFIALSPWIVGFTGPLQINNLVVGLVIAAIGFGFAGAYTTTHRIAWVCPVLGAWTIVSLWAVNGAVTTTGSVLSNVLAGVAVLLGGLAILGMSTERMTRVGLRHR